jgi:hypothetical protein
MKPAITFLALVCCCQTMAQQKYIEVTVSDTVLVKPDLFIYKIILTPDDDPQEFVAARRGHQPMEDVYEQRLSKGKNRFDSLKSALRAGGYAVYRSSLGDSVNIIQPEMSLFFARVITHSIDSLEILSRRLRDMKGLRGYLEESVATQDSSFQEELFRKILRRARAKAESIAAFNDQHVRGVLTVTEGKKEDVSGGGWTSYPPLSALTEDLTPGWHTTISGPSKIVVGNLSAIGWYPLSGTFTVRFWVD